MMIIKWRKDEMEEQPLYELYAYTETNYRLSIGFLGWSDFMNSWLFSYEIPSLKSKSKIYNNYTINEFNDVLFRAILDIQSELSRINNMCIEYCNAISDYVIDYIQGVDHNED